MTKLMKYRVVREHGEFAEGAIREADAADVAHLIPNSLELIGPADSKEESVEKAESAAKNKAEPAAPANKAATGRKGKGKA